MSTSSFTRMVRCLMGSPSGYNKRDGESALPLDVSSYCFIANSLSGIAHMAGVADGPTPKTAPLPWRGDLLHIRALCGAQLPSAPGCCTAYTSFPAGFELCRRLGCTQGPGCYSLIKGTPSGVPLIP